MIIDCHGHFTTVPKALGAWRQKQLDSNGHISPGELKISDDGLRQAVFCDSTLRVYPRVRNKI